jgi:aminoglycoside phosphotransferase (APT) family kinase protein
VARSALVLAALMSAAMPAVDPATARAVPPSQAPDGVDAAWVGDADGRTWEVRAPVTAAAGAALEREAAVLAALGPLGARLLPGAPEERRGGPSLPFAVAAVAASVPLDEGGRAVVLPRPPGAPLAVEELGRATGRASLAASVGRALAAVHDLPGALLEDAGAPVHTAADYRERRLAAVDRAAATGLVPSALLARWERGLEDVGRWRFSPAVVHGELTADDVLVAGGSVTAVVRWGSAKVADPADDLAWLAAGASEEALEVVLEAYAGARRGQHDAHLVERARLVSELALADWLLHGVRTDDQGVVDDAHAMLRDLEAATVASRV